MQHLRPFGYILGVGVMGLLLTGCAGGKHKAERVFQRGWIGGEYKLAHVPRFLSPSDSINAFPASLSRTQKAGILILALSTNAPARAAGLREGDLLVEVDHQSVTSSRAFRRLIEQRQPGTLLPVRVWRDAQFSDRQVRVGKETYRKQGYLSLGLIIHHFNLGHNADFSLAVLGYQRNPGSRVELDSTDQVFTRECSPGYHPTEQDWAVWLAIMEISRGKLILSQDPAPEQYARAALGHD